MAELNGSPITPQEALQLGLVNFGHFTTMRVEDRHVRGLSHHLDRLVYDSLTLFHTDLDRDRVRQLVRRTVGDERGTLIVRVTVFDPALELGHLGAVAEPDLLVTTRPATTKWSPSPMRVKSVTYCRDLPGVKHVGLFGSLWHRRMAQRAGYDDALFIDGSSFLSEGVTWNVGCYDGERVVWPNAEVLPGITLRLLKQAYDQAITAPVSLNDLGRMDAMFATNATVGVRAIAAVDDIQLADEHPIFRTLRKEYEGIPAELL